ncbi:virulence factor [Lichenifustis flavocetrariae]|uniref:Endoribonuclease VapD n=1 Tax=Lichenifustis flavocetrariae TaxID=2949735 RepID=A0AA41Z1G9_9HYPH|nr:virulence factor [Lichenifustis flavocetrariae]MCW6512464.1 virulence factor [Lichenifustis flavocetrariae]
MFAIAFDLIVAEVQTHHPKGIAQAYNDIRTTLAGHGFNWIQGSLYLSQTEDLTQLFSAILSLKGLPWLPRCVRDIRAFRVEQWSDFTTLVKD